MAPAPQGAAAPQQESDMAEAQREQDGALSAGRALDPRASFRRLSFAARLAKEEIEEADVAASTGDHAAAIQLAAAGLRHSGQSAAMAGAMLSLQDDQARTRRLAQEAQQVLADLADFRAKSSLGVAGVPTDRPPAERASMAAGIVVRSGEILPDHVGAH